MMLALGLCVGLYRSGRQIKTELARIRAAGEPVTAAELEAFYSLPPGSRDATGLWLHAAEVVAGAAYQADLRNLGIGDYNKVLPTRNGAWPQQAAAERLLAKYADLLGTLHKAAAMGGTARYPTHFADGAGMIFRVQRELRHVAFLLVLESEVHARRGEGHAAAASLHALFALARSLELEPLNVSQLARLANDHTAVDEFERLLATVDLSDDDLTVIDDDLAAIDYCAGFQRGMLGDRVFGMQEFAHPDVVGGQASGSRSWTILRQSDFAVYLQLMSALVAASKATDALALRDAIDDADERVRAA
ncbi:MAG TPA: hypothetical protein PK867_12915 [Pirellulales bacterium]|nr:hypothetical protein [Pirellulales bacterium]